MINSKIVTSPIINRVLTFIFFIVVFMLSISVSDYAMADSFDCKPIEVMELGNRIHVKCSQGAHYNPGRSGNGLVFRYFAIDKNDKEKANRFASLATAAMVSGLSFRVEYSTIKNENVPGCLPGDCRTPSAFGISK